MKRSVKAWNKKDGRVMGSSSALTEAETVTLSAFAANQALSRRKIAEMLGISLRTLESRITVIMEKLKVTGLDVEGIHEAAAKALELGLVGI